MRPLMLDPTAVERARAIRMRPAMPQLVVDRTDARFGLLATGNDVRSGAMRVFDPTDPGCGRSRLEPPIA